MHFFFVCGLYCHFFSVLSYNIKVRISILQHCSKKLDMLNIPSTRNIMLLKNGSTLLLFHVRLKSNDLHIFSLIYKIQQHNYFNSSNKLNSYLWSDFGHFLLYSLQSLRRLYKSGEICLSGDSLWENSQRCGTLAWGKDEDCAIRPPGFKS